MKFIRLFVFVILTIIIGASNSSGRSAARRGYAPLSRIPQTNVVETDLIYDISVPGETHAVGLVILIPKSIPHRQKILSRKYSHKPSRIFQVNDNHYAEFIIRKPERNEKVKITIKAELYRYDLLTAKTDTIEENTEESDLRDFLTSERFIESDDDQIRQLAKGIEGETELDIVKGIYDVVIDGMNYVVRGENDKGALFALQQGKGDCTEYSDLFVALCRARNIPARVISGYTVRQDVETAKHNWVEVYIKDRGWVPIDPTAGDMGNSIYRNRAFTRMRPVYIYFSHIRNDRVLKNHNFGTYRYWGDKVSLSDSVEFRFPEQQTADNR